MVIYIKDTSSENVRKLKSTNVDDQPLDLNPTIVTVHINSSTLFMNKLLIYLYLYIFHCYCCQQLSLYISLPLLS